jgi:hypothetical protein
VTPTAKTAADNQQKRPCLRTPRLLPMSLNQLPQLTNIDLGKQGVLLHQANKPNCLFENH